MAGITVNKNAIPFDLQPKTVTSGIRLGTPAVTTRGMKEGEMRGIAAFIHQALSAPDAPENLAKLRTQIQEFCRQFPLFAREWEV